MQNKQHVAVFDIDDTIVHGQSQKILLHYLRKKHLIGPMYFIRLYIWFVLYKLSLVKNPKKIVEYAIAFLANKNQKEVAQLCTEFVFSVLSQKIYHDAHVAIKKHQNTGHTVILISNAIEPLVKAIAQHLHLTQYLATSLAFTDTTYTGKLTGQLMYGKEKVRALKRYLHANGIKNYVTSIYTDHESDIPLLTFADKPYACNPTKKLEKYAKSMHWNVLHFK